MYVYKSTEKLYLRPNYTKFRVNNALDYGDVNFI